MRNMSILLVLAAAVLSLSQAVSAGEVSAADRGGNGADVREARLWAAQSASAVQGAAVNAPVMQEEAGMPASSMRRPSEDK